MFLIITILYSNFIFTLILIYKDLVFNSYIQILFSNLKGKHFLYLFLNISSSPAPASLRHDLRVLDNLRSSSMRVSPIFFQTLHRDLRHSLVRSETRETAEVETAGRGRPDGRDRAVARAHDCEGKVPGRGEASEEVVLRGTGEAAREGPFRKAATEGKVKGPSRAVWAFCSLPKSASSF